ncbi:MAG: DUF4861 domain-containing protein [Prevotella sp.]|nr:DUF4861 domain-containing protein [Prevotella sp.]
MRKTATLLVLAAMPVALMAQKSFELSLKNESTIPAKDYPVSINLKAHAMEVRSAMVTDNGKEIPCQLDDLDGDGTYDELFLLTDLERRGEKTLKVTLYDSGAPRQYEPKVYVDMMLTNKKIKESNKQDLYIQSLTVDRDVNPYWMLHHHGAAFENELVAYRIYFDHRQTVDIYGKYRKGLELKQTQFYPDTEQKAAGFGDDVLWVGNTFGVGTLRGWDGKEPVMVSDVEHRGQRIVARGPLRTIVEVKDEAWRVTPTSQPVDMTTLYTLHAGHRDCRVDVSFSRDVSDLRFSTGVINVKNSTEFSDKKGLRGCWGTDWPVSEKDSAGHKRETVGLGICLPQEVVENELPANKDNYPYVVKVSGNHLTYHISFCSDNESFGMHSEKEWYACLQEWKKALGVKVTVKTR